MQSFTNENSATVKIILETRVTRKDNRHPVKLRVTFNRVQKYYVVKGENYTELEYNQIMSENSRGKNRDKRLKLIQIESYAQKIASELGGDFTFDLFKAKFCNKKKDSIDLKDLFEMKIAESNEAGKIRLATMYRTTLNSLLRYDPKANLQKITPQFLEKYEKWMLGKDKSVTTISIYLRQIKHIIKTAVEEGLINHYPFGSSQDKYSIPHAKTKKRALGLTDIQKIMRYEPADDNELLAKNYFIFSYLCNGMNMIDVANLKFKNIDGDVIRFIREKTKDTSREVQTISVTLLPQIKEIIELIGNEDQHPDNFIFPIFSKELTPVEKLAKLQLLIKRVNKYLKRIADKIDINPKITTYWARHSYSTIQKRAGASIEFISEQLGHQDIRTTRNYLDTFEDEQRAKFAAALIPKDDTETDQQ